MFIQFVFKRSISHILIRGDSDKEIDIHMFSVRTEKCSKKLKRSEACADEHAKLHTDSKLSSESNPCPL